MRPLRLLSTCPILFCLLLTTLAPLARAGERPFRSDHTRNQLYTPRHCSQLWNAQNIDLAQAEVVQRVGENILALSSVDRAALEEQIIWRTIHEAIHLRLISDGEKLHWLKSSFEKSFEIELRMPSSQGVNVNKRTEQRIRSNLVSEGVPSLFTGMSDYNEFLRSYFLDFSLLSHERIVAAIKLASQLEQWSLARSTFVHLALKMQFKQFDSKISADQKLELMGQLLKSLSTPTEKKSSFDFLYHLKFGFMPKNYLEFDLEPAIQVRVITKERERLEFFAAHPLTPSGVKAEVIAHLAFLQRYGLDLDTTAMAVNDQISELKATIE